MLQIGEVAEVVGLSLRTIRYWDEQGIVRPSGRSPGGFRLYTEPDLERLRLVKDMKPLDFTLDEIREVLELLDRLDAGGRDPERRAVVDRLSMYVATGEQRCVRLRDRLGAAESFLAAVRR